MKVDAFGNGVIGSVRTVLFHRFYGDVSGDATVTIADFNVFAPAFGTTVGQAGFVDAVDYNGDNVIDIIDFNQFAPRFGLNV